MGTEAYNWCVEQGIANMVDHVIQINTSALGDAVWSRTNDAVKTFLEKSGLTEDSVESIDITNYDLATSARKFNDYLPLCADYKQIVIFCLSSSWTPASWRCGCLGT
jgi:predicted Zn-dependent peptidase